MVVHIYTMDMICLIIAFRYQFKLVAQIMLVIDATILPFIVFPGETVFSVPAFRDS